MSTRSNTPMPKAPATQSSASRFAVRGCGWLLALLLGLATTAAVSPSTAQAQQELRAGPDGMLGLGLVGAEIGMVVPAMLGVSETWPYLVFPGVGAIGGGVAGIFLLQDGSFSPGPGQGSPEISVVAFAVGLVGLIPSLVAVMSATAYDPETDEVAKRLPGGQLGGGLVRVGDEGTFVGVPNVSVAQRPADRQRLTEARSEVSVSVLTGRF